MSLEDPDNGSVTVQALTAQTRAEPDFLPNTPATRTATPATLASTLSGAKPGDIIELQPGAYAGFSAAIDGTATAPIIIRGQSATGVIVNGSVSINSRKYVTLARMTVNGTVNAKSADSFGIMGLIINTKSNGIYAINCPKRGFIADNRITGPTRWASTSLGSNGSNTGEGILFTGPGHMVRNNEVKGFRDDISFVEGSSNICEQYSIDVMYNELSRAGDDGVEADYCQHNCRIAWNRITNVFIAMSSQPGLGGPTYFIGNSVYNTIQGPFKLYNGSRGDVILYNTVVKNGDPLGVYTSTTYSRQLFLNNVFIGGPGGSYNGYSNNLKRVASLAAIRDAYLDYDAYGYTSNTFSGVIGPTSFASIGEMRSRTTEKNAQQIDLGIFAANIAYPNAPMTEYSPQDLRPRAAADVVDTGVCIPNIRTCSSGFPPDRGAYELGDALPVYGPRY
jgi:hypothetical protein